MGFAKQLSTLLHLLVTSHNELTCHASSLEFVGNVTSSGICKSATLDVKKERVG